MSKFFLSIVIPVYNVEKYIKECFLSVFDSFQDEYPVEIIFVNDGSTDSSKEILINEIEKLNSVVKNKVTLVTQLNKGLSGARNAGISIARGTYIYFLDSDDFLHKDFFKNLLPLLGNDFDIIEFNSIKFHYKNNEIVENYHKNILNKGLNLVDNEQSRLQLFSWQDWAVWYRVFNRNLITESFFPEGYLYEDVMTVPFVYNRVKKVYSLDKYLIFYRMNPNSIMNTKNKKCLISTDYALNIFNYADKTPYLNVVRSRFIIASTFNLVRNDGFIKTYFWLKENSINLSKSDLKLVKSKKLNIANKYPLILLFYIFLKNKWLYI